MGVHSGRLRLSDPKNRRSLTPSTGIPAGEDAVHATRRGGARHEVSSRVTLKSKGGEVHEGWALNVSRGGIRVILEEKVELGAEFEVTISTGGDTAAPVVGRIVWVQEEPDGVVAGIEFR
ncbi:MAG: PilZ domain-containing protein [Polyangiaceae bacterium]